MGTTDEAGRQRAIEAAAEVLAVGVAGGLGGPVGAVAAAAATPYLRELTRRAWDEMATRRLDSAAGVVARSAEALGVTVDEVIELANADADRQHLFAEALYAAAHTVSREKLTALATAVANGLRDDGARVDSEHLMVIALADLENAHVRLLLQMAPGRRGQFRSAHSWGLPAGLGKVSAPVVMATLHRHSLVETDELARAQRKLTERLGTSRKAPRESPKKAKPPKWRCSTFGVRCARYLEGLGNRAAE